MNYIEKDFGKILKHNALQMRRLTLKNGTDCMRVYDRNLEALPVTVDLYGPYVRITDYSEEGLDDDMRRVCCDIAARMLYVQADHVVFHQRKKRQGREQHELQSEESLLVPVKEGGLSFTVDLTKRIDTGLFLDHALTRAMIRDLSAGLSVLNLFAYTGAFSVYAASGGAKRVVSVDMSTTYSTWCEENLRANGFVGPEFPCVTEDAWRYIRRAVKEGEKFDLIVFDPPSFSNSRKMEHDFDVQRDHVRWVRMLNRLLTQDGLLLFSTNLGTFRLDKGSIRGYETQEITFEVAAPGFSKQKGSTRSWILKKEHEVQIPAEDLREPEVPVSAPVADEETAKTVKKPRKARKKMEAQEAPQEVVQEEMTQTEETKMEDETPEMTVAMEEPAEKEVVVETVEHQVGNEPESEAEALTEPEAENDEVVERQVQDMTAADDLLSLDWNDDDAVSESDEQVPGEESEVAARNERKADRREDGREERPRRDRRDDDRRDGRSRDRGRDDRGRGSYGDRDRRSFGDRDSRPRYNDDRRPSYGDRDDRRSFGDRDSRPRYNDDRRPSYGGRDDRRSFGDRDSRPRYNDDRRPSYGNRDDRRSFGDRDGKPRYNDDRRPSYGNRDDRRSFGDRDGKPRYNDDRRPYGDRDDRRGQDRPYGRREDSDRGFKPRRYDDNGGDRRPWGDRPQRDGGFRKDAGPRRDGDFKRDDSKGFDKPRSKGPKPYGFDQFKATRTRGEEEDSSFFWLSDDEKN